MSSITLSSTTLSAPLVLNAVGDPWPVLLNPDTQQQGLIAEIVREAYLTQGYELAIDFVPWSRAMKMIQKKRADLLIGAWYSDERNEYLRYSKPILSSAVKFIKRKGANFEYQALASLEGKRIGTILSYHYNKAFLNDYRIEKINSDTLLDNINNLIADRIDLTLDDQHVLKHTLDKHFTGWENTLAVVENSFIEKNIFIAANRTNPESEAIIKAFNLGLAQLKKEGRYQRIVDSYLLED
jgi:polar amino acid transport system substrate-binding protein